MTDNYFENLRIVGASLDEGLNKLQETWKMPHLLLCKSNEEDQLAAQKLIKNMREELNILKQSLEADKTMIKNLREAQSLFFEDTLQDLNKLKEEVNDIKVLFEENGYVDEPLEDDLSLLNSQLELLSVNTNSSLLKETSEDITDYSIDDNNSLSGSPVIVDPVPTETLETPPRNGTINSVHKKSLLNQRPMEPVYSPYYYKVMKKK